MEHKNSFHIKKLNHQSGFGWAEMMRAGYVWLAALLCFIWYAADRFEMDTAGVALFIGAAFFILLYFVGISVGKGFTVFISGLYFFKYAALKSSPSRRERSCKCFRFCRAASVR